LRIRANLSLQTREAPTARSRAGCLQEAEGQARRGEARPALAQYPLLADTA
jgi:hypothetical protein